jgi:uroporphyrinogen decarboxylase
MNSKERLLTALEHSEPDRVPIFANLTPRVGDRLGNELGLPGEGQNAPWQTRRLSKT